MHAKVKASTKNHKSKNQNIAHPKSGIESSPFRSSSVEHIVHLQRTVGNRTVNRLLESGVIQAKLKIGQTGGVYEKEADRVVDRVMRMDELVYEEETAQTKSLSDHISLVVQKHPKEEEIDKKQ